LDGWGDGAETKGKQLALARKPAYDELIKNFSNTLIHTSDRLSLPEGQMATAKWGI